MFTITWYIMTGVYTPPITGENLDIKEKIWYYDGNNQIDQAVNHTSFNIPFAMERVNSDIPVTNGHSIRIKSLTLEAEVMYACKLEMMYGLQKYMAYIKVNVLGINNDTL